MKQITLKVFNNSIEAHLLKSKLANIGVSSTLLNEHSSTLYPINNNSNGGIRMQINESDKEMALLVISDLENKNYFNEGSTPVVCPNCASTEITPKKNNTKGFKGFLSLLSLLFFGILTVSQKYVFVCDNCKSEFKAKA